MAEIFKNFISKSKTGEKIIVPMAGEIVSIDSTKQNNGEILREEDSTAQVHSIYISQMPTSRFRGDNRYLESNFNYIDLFVEDENGNKVYLAYDVQVVPGSPYYIEKNVTLTPKQCLKVNIPSNQGLNGRDDIHIVASTILFTDDIED